MQTAVWDTYVKKKDGNTMHFDIIVPADCKSPETIYGYGREYLSQKGEPQSRIDAEECRFCHIEEPAPEMKEAISRQGYFILEMDEIPAQLPLNPARRDLILYLKAHHKNYRFADFKGKSLEEIRALLH